MYKFRQEASPDIVAVLQLLGLVGSPGKGKHANFDRVRRGINEICAALRARIVTPLAHLPSLEERLHHAKVVNMLPGIVIQHTVCTLEESSRQGLTFALWVDATSPELALDVCSCHASAIYVC